MSSRPSQSDGGNRPPTTRKDSSIGRARGLRLAPRNFKTQIVRTDESSTRRDVDTVAVLHSTTGILEVGAACEVRLISPGGEKLLGLNAAAVVGQSLKAVGIKVANRMGDPVISLAAPDQIPFDSEVQATVGARRDLLLAVQRIRRGDGGSTLVFRELTPEILRVRCLKLTAGLRGCWENPDDPAAAMARLIQVLVHQFDADHAWVWETSEAGVVAGPRPKVEAMGPEYDLPAYGYGEIPESGITLAEPVLYSASGFAQFSTTPPNGPVGSSAHHYFGAMLRMSASGGAMLLLERKSSKAPWGDFDAQMLRENFDMISASFENLRLRERVEESAMYLANVLKSADIGVLFLDRTASGHRVSLLNDRVCEFFAVQREELEHADETAIVRLLGSRLGDSSLIAELLVHPKRDHTCELITTGETPRVLQMFSTPATDSSGSPFGRLFLFRDITRDKEVERQLLHSQKMESIGTLAGGIAHDFNNLLTTMLGYSELLRRDIPETDSRFAKVEQIERSARRAAELTSNLLAFSRRTPTQMQVLDVGQLVQKTMGIIRFSVPSSIEIRLDLAESLPCVEGDETQLEQVLINLVINARDALPDEKGVITIQAWLGKDSQKQPGGSGDFVVLEVDDNGVGISQQELSRIFEPFYTTKEVGKGTGLGLSMVYGIVKQHNGFIEVASAPSLGSTFSVYIPATTKKPTPKPIADKPKARPAEKKHGRLLVVDDEEDLLEFCALSLDEICERVTTAADGLEAVELVEAKGDEIDLVLLDLTMPRMGGVEAFYRMRKARPKLKIVISSGYSLGAGVSELLENGASAFLQKPYTIDGLQQVVQSCLRS